MSEIPQNLFAGKITMLLLFTVTPSIPKPGYPGFSGAQNSVNTYPDELPQPK